MGESQRHLQYFVGLFDVLGFDSRFRRVGLAGMDARYGALIEGINGANVHATQLAEFFNVEDDVLGAADGDVFVFNRVHGAYASDSLLLWSHAEFPEARGLAEDEIKARARDASTGWQYHSIPCDRFLDACNELICRAVQSDLPLRGAIAFGAAILDVGRRVFLGQPLIDAARLEKKQRFIGAGFTPSFLTQIVPDRYKVPFAAQMKEGGEQYYAGFALDWPRHGRRTRKSDVRPALAAQRSAWPDFASYYNNTLAFVETSAARADQFETSRELSVRSNYPQFASDEISIRVMAVRGP
jgi:hypothetical protein